MVSEGETNIVEKSIEYSGDLAEMRRGQDAPQPGDELTSHSVSEPLIRAVRTNEKRRYRNSVPPRDVTGEVFELDDAAVQTTAVAVFAGT